jgi:hypothetical protein
MAINIYVKLQTPVVELTIEAKDASGKKDKFVAGFKRYEINEANSKLKELEYLQKQIYLNNKEILDQKYEYLTSTKVEQNDTVKAEITEEAADKAINEFIKGEISYLKNVTVDIVDNGVAKELKIADTRTVKPNEPLWGTPEECLSVLVDSFLACAPFRGSLITMQQKALFNLDYKDAEIKN